MWICLLFISESGLREARAQTDHPARITVDTVEERGIEGKIASLGDRLTLTMDDGGRREIPADSLVSIAPVGRRKDTPDPESLVLLVNGDTATGTVMEMSNDVLTILWKGDDGDVSLHVPLESVRSIVLKQPDDKTQRLRLRRQWGLPHVGPDRMLLLSGNYVDGEILRLDQTHLVMDTKLGPVETAREKIAAISLNMEFAADPDPLEQYTIVLINDGSRITLQDVRFSEGVLSGRSVFGPGIECSLLRINRMQFFSNHVVSLATRPTADYVFVPYLTEEHPLVRNRNVHGGPLFLRGQRLATGLGMHSRSQVDYDMTETEMESFSATVGIDDLTEGNGNVIFAVEVDGVRVFDSGNVDGHTEPLNVGPIDIVNARRLTLLVDFGRLGNIQDVANWCDPVLMKAP